MTKVVMVVAPENFRDEELFGTKSVLESRRIDVILASKGVRQATGMLGRTAEIDLDIKDIHEEDFDALVLIGGSGAAVYFEDKTILELVKKFDDKQKIIGAICIAPMILANSGILKNIKATSFKSQQKNLEKKGAVLADSDVVVDRNIITARGPFASAEFGKKIAEKLSQ